MPGKKDGNRSSFANDRDELRAMGESGALDDFARDPRNRKVLEARANERTARFAAIMQNGAGMVADQLLRAFLRVFSDRLLVLPDGKDLPASFAAVEDFLDYDPRLMLFTLPPERDYLISMGDFVDFVRGPHVPAGIDSAYQFEENAIYHFSALDDPRQLLVQGQNGAEYGIVSYSAIRRGDILQVLLVVGEPAGNPAPAASASIMVVDSDARPGSRTRKAVDGWPELFQTAAVARLNLARRTIEARFLMHFYDTMTQVHVDLSESELSGKPGQTPASDVSLTEIERNSVLYGLIETAVWLPAYLAYRVDLVVPERRQTKLGRDMKSLKVQRALRALPPDERVAFRKISAIRVHRPTPTAETGRSYNPPVFAVTVEGFWRTFANPDWIGHDERGRPVAGKTFVHAHLRWQDRPAKPVDKTVLIKESVRQAELKVEQRVARPQPPRA